MLKRLALFIVSCLLVPATLLAASQSIETSAYGRLHAAEARPHAVAQDASPSIVVTHRAPPRARFVHFPRSR